MGSTLQKGEIQYKELLEEIRTLRIKIAALKRELHIAKQQVTNIDDLKKEVYQLQRELLQERTKVKALSEELEKDLAIQEKEKLYLEMRNLLSKQPGPELVEEVGKQQQSLKEKTKQMKAMAAELNMYHAQLNDYKDEIERLTKELQDTKRRYFEQRRREQLVKDTSTSG